MTHHVGFRRLAIAALIAWFIFASLVYLWPILTRSPSVSFTWIYDFGFSPRVGQAGQFDYFPLFRWSGYAAVVMGPPALLLTCGWAILWVTSGFADEDHLRDAYSPVPFAKRLAGRLRDRAVRESAETSLKSRLGDNGIDEVSVGGSAVMILGWVYSLRIIRAVAGFVFAWQVVTLFTSFLSVAQSSRDVELPLALVVVKVLIGALALVLFVWLRRVVNRLYTRRLGIEPPPLSSFGRL